MGNVQSCAGPAGHPRRRTGVRRDWDKAPDSTKMTVLQRSKLAAWQSAHPNPLRLVLGVDLPDAMPEDVAEIKHALDEYAKDPTGEVQFSGSDLADEDGAGGSDGALSRLHGADFSDRDDSDSSDDRDFGDESFVIPTDFEDTDNFSAGGAFSDAHTLGGEGSAEWADEDGAFVAPSTLKHFEHQLRSISSDFSGKLRREAHVASGFGADIMYPKVSHQAFLHVRRTRFHPGEDCIVCVRPILGSVAAAREAPMHKPSAGPAFGDSSPRGDAPSIPAHCCVAGYRIEAFSAKTFESAHNDTLFHVFIVTAECYVSRVNGANLGETATAVIDYASGQSMVFSAAKDEAAQSQLQQAVAIEAHAAAAADAHEGESKTGASMNQLLSMTEWVDVLRQQCDSLSAQLPPSDHGPIFRDGLLSFAPLVASAKGLDLSPFSMLSFETTVFSASQLASPGNSKSCSYKQTGAADQAVVLRPLVPRDSPLGAAAGAAGALDDPLAAFGAGRDMPTELTDGRGGYTASYDAQPPKRWAFLACEALQGDAVAFTTSVYLVDEEDGQRYLLATIPPSRVGNVRSQGSDFTLHHVEQYTVSVPVDGQLPFAIVDDSDGSGCVCVERLTAISDPEEHAASIYHMIHEGDHVISVNDNDVQYAFDVSASMKKAQMLGQRFVTFVMAGVRTSGVLSLRNISQFRGRPVEQLKHLVEATFARIWQSTQNTFESEGAWQAHLRAMQAEFHDIVAIADLVLSYAQAQGFDSKQVFWWVLTRAKAFNREGREFREALRATRQAGLDDENDPTDVELKLQWAHAALRAFIASAREYKFLEQHFKREFVTRGKFVQLDKILSLQVKCVDMVQFYTGASAKLRSGSEDDSNVDAREGAALQVFRQQFGAMPAPDNLLDAFNESLLDRLGRVWHLLKQRVELSETYPFESESRIKQDIVDEMVRVENAMSKVSSASGPLLVVGQAALGMRTEDVREF